MRVSVVIPTYNRSQLLPRALASVVSQSRAADEIIVVDDGSTDATEALVGGSFPQVRYLRQERRGVSAARNRGIDATSGEWVALLDSDDEWLPGKLEVQLAALERAPGFRLCHSDEIWMRRGRRVNPRRRHAKSGGQIFRRCLPLCVISPSSTLLRRSLLEETAGFDESLPACEDYDLWLRVCSREPVLYVDEPLLIRHGGHDDQLSRTPAQDRYRIQALEKLLWEGRLTPGDRAATIATLLEKIEIFASGAEKRGHREVAEEYRCRHRRWASSAPPLAASEESDR